MELWLIGILSPSHQSIFRYLRIITHDGNATVFIKAKFILNETKTGRSTLISCLQRLRSYNMISTKSCGKRGLEIDIVPINEWFRVPKKNIKE